MLRKKKKLAQNCDVPEWSDLSGTHWKFVRVDDEPFQPSKHEGFIYKVTFLLEGVSYIGKKSFWKKTRTGRRVGNSNWKRYLTSSDHILALLKQYPMECFAWEIILLCRTQAMLSHAEANIIHKVDAVTSSSYYNGRAEAVKWVTKDYPRKRVNNLIRKHVLRHTWDGDI